MLREPDLVAFVGCRDLEVAGRFYGDVLGLELTESSSLANAYRVGGTELRVTRVDEPVSAPYTVLGLEVADIAESVHELREAGVNFKDYEGLEQDADQIWTAPGATRVAWFKDPDGNTLSLQQRLAGRPGQPG